MKTQSLITFVCLLMSPVVKADTIPGDGGPIEITPLVHSSVQLEYQGRVIHVDPWDLLGLPGAKPADLILITDNPGHHLDVAAVEKLRKASTPVVIAANGKEQIPDGIVVSIGESVRVAGVTVKAIAAYDIILGEPSHPRGDANGYVFDFGGKRFFFAGVTECVDEVKALTDIDVAFLPMNIPLGRMTPAATAECAKSIGANIVYPYHYDQGYQRRLANPNFEGAELPGGLSIEESLQRLSEELQGSGIEVRLGNFYPSAE